MTINSIDNTLLKNACRKEIYPICFTQILLLANFWMIAADKNDLIYGLAQIQEDARVSFWTFGPDQQRW